MTRIGKEGRAFICCLCVVLAFVCAFCMLLPHLHECEGVECSVCALCSALKLLILTVAGVLLVTVTVLHTCRECKPVGFESCSLVQLKVKLSD